MLLGRANTTTQVWSSQHSLNDQKINKADFISEQEENTELSENRDENHQTNQESVNDNLIDFLCG